MRLPWRKPDVFDKNPWDDDVGLSGWVPGLNDRLDMMAMMASLAKGQWSLAQWLSSVSRGQTVMSRCFMIAALGWVVVAAINMNYIFKWW